jgi:uncharacterized membrane protein
MSLLEQLTLVSALGCALIGGVFYAFSSFVMRALGALPPPNGVAAMQSINVVVLNPWFLVPFLGTALTCAILVVAALFGGDDPRAPYRLAGGALYLVGTVLVTMVFNVPRNDTLAAVVPDTPAAASLWADYLSGWTFWNHVRTAAGLVAALLLVLALVIRSD